MDATVSQLPTYPPRWLSLRRIPQDARLWIGGQNRASRRIVERALSLPRVLPNGPLDGAILTPLTAEEAVYFASKLLPRLTPEATVWVVCASESASPGTSSAPLVQQVEVALLATSFVSTAIDNLEAPYVAVGFLRREG